MKEYSHVKLEAEVGVVTTQAREDLRLEEVRTLLQAPEESALEHHASTGASSTQNCTFCFSSLAVSHSSLLGSQEN